MSIPTGSDPFLYRARAMMLGSALGDAAGAPTEFLRWPEIEKTYGLDGLVDLEAGPWGRGGYTDDTQMAISVATGLLRSGAPLDVSRVADAIALEFVDWDFRHDFEPGFSRDPGVTCRRSTRRLRAGVHRSEAAAPVPFWENDEAGPDESKRGPESMGNGAVMRAHPVAIAYRTSKRERRAVAKVQAETTHDSPTAAAGAAWWCDLLAGVLAGKALTVKSGDLAVPGPAFVEAELGEDDAFAPYANALAYLLGIAALHPDAPDDTRRWINDFAAGRSALAPHLVTSTWTTPGAILAAVVIAAQHGDDFRTAVLVAANLDGDSDTVGALVGALVGAMSPASIPDAWLAVLQDAFMLDGLAFGLTQLGDLVARSDF